MASQTSHATDIYLWLAELWVGSKQQGAARQEQAPAADTGPRAQAEESLAGVIIL